MAVEQHAKLVPVVCLGEVSALQNPIDLPDMQRWTYKNLGFPVPYWVVGRWGVSPFPKRVGLKFIIGEPISPRPHVPGTQVSRSVMKHGAVAKSGACVYVCGSGSYLHVGHTCRQAADSLLLQDGCHLWCKLHMLLP